MVSSTVEHEATQGTALARAREPPPVPKRTHAPRRQRKPRKLRKRTKTHGHGTLSERDVDEISPVEAPLNVKSKAIDAEFGAVGELPEPPELVYRDRRKLPRLLTHPESVVTHRLMMSPGLFRLNLCLTGLPVLAHPAQVVVKVTLAKHDVCALFCETLVLSGSQREVSLRMRVCDEDCEMRPAVLVIQLFSTARLRRLGADVELLRLPSCCVWTRSVDDSPRGAHRSTRTASAIVLDSIQGTSSAGAHR